LSNLRRLRPLVAAVVLAAAVLPAPASAAGKKTGVPSTAKMAKQIRALQQLTASLTGQVSALQAKTVELEANRAAPSQSINSAGGDLVGLFPNPQIRTGTIVGNDIADATILGRNVAPNTLFGTSLLDGTIGSVDIANGSIQQADLGQSIVGAQQVTGAFVVRSGPNPVGGNNASGGNDVSCPAGSRLISGGAEWDVPADNLAIYVSGPSADQPNTKWEVGGQNNSGATHSIFAKALCLGL
jgi:hypothetical protein